MRPYIELIAQNTPAFVICYPNAGKLFSQYFNVHCDFQEVSKLEKNTTELHFIITEICFWFSARFDDQLSNQREKYKIHETHFAMNEWVAYFPTEFYTDT